MRFKSCLFIFCGIVAISGCTPQTAPVVGRTITSQTAPSLNSEAHGFAVWMPAIPVESQRSKPLGNGETVNAFIFTAAQTATQPVTYIAIASPTSPSADLKAKLDVAQKGFIQGSASTLQSSEDIQLSGFQGREVKLRLASDSAAIRVRFYVTPKYFYQIMARCPENEIQQQSAQIDKVLDSFRILPQ